jgi:hypothetical protein
MFRFTVTALGTRFRLPLRFLPKDVSSVSAEPRWTKYVKPNGTAIALHKVHHVRAMLAPA